MSPISVCFINSMCWKDNILNILSIYILNHLKIYFHFLNVTGNFYITYVACVTFLLDNGGLGSYQSSRSKIQEHKIIHSYSPSVSVCACLCLSSLPSLLIQGNSSIWKNSLLNLSVKTDKFSKIMQIPPWPLVVPCYCLVFLFLLVLGPFISQLFPYPTLPLTQLRLYSTF